LGSAFGPRSLLLLDGREHLHERKMMLPPFHGERMRGYRVFTLLMLEPDGPTVDAWRRYAPTLRGVDERLYAEIRLRRAQPDLTERTDILSLLLQARDHDGRPMGDEHLRDELMTLLIAGHDTTATALAWALERLARRPNLYERLRTENEDGSDGLLDAVVAETSRIRPVIPFAIRQVAAPVDVAGYRLPAGVGVAPCIHLVHRRPDLYPDPHAFRPERFWSSPPAPTAGSRSGAAPAAVSEAPSRPSR
jgi:cytochrome P450 family 135